MRQFQPFATFLLAAAGLFAACSRESTATESKPDRDLGTKVQGTIDSGKEKLAAAQQEYRAKLDTKLAELDTSIAKLKQKAAESGDEGKAKWNELVRSLETKREEVKSKLGDWKSISADKWQAFTTDLNKVVDDLQRSATEAIEKLK